MAAFTLTVAGQMEKIDGTHAKMKIIGTPDGSISGGTVYIKYTKGPEASITITPGILNVAVDPTNPYIIPKLNYGTYESAAFTITGSGTQYISWPVAAPKDNDGYLYFIISGSGIDSTTTLLLHGRRDTLKGV